MKIGTVFRLLKSVKMILDLDHCLIVKGRKYNE